MKYIFYALTSGFVACVAALVFVSSVGYNTLTNKLPKFVVELQPLVPQGWNFFTRDAKEGQIHLYAYDATSDTFEKINMRRTQLRHQWGVSYRTSNLYVGLQEVYLSIPAPEFCDCSFNYGKPFRGDCLSESPYDVVMDPEKPEKLPPGEYVLVVSEIIPWAWRNRGFKDMDLESKAIKLKIS